MLFPLIKHWRTSFTLIIFLGLLLIIRQILFGKLNQFLTCFYFLKPSFGVVNYFRIWVVNYFGFAWSISVDYTGIYAALDVSMPFQGTALRVWDGGET